MKMAFRPTDCWRWFFDSEYDCLMLEVSDEMLFRSCYSSKMLIPDVFREFPFSVSDATSYYLFHDSCQSLNLTDAQKIELSINAIIAANFLKPQMPKSWYFIQQPKFFIPKIADIVEVNMQEGGKTVYLMVVEPGANASLCIIAQPTFIAMNKTFNFAEAIKVMNDRLIPATHNLVDNMQEITDLQAIS